jgi:hypothetical protein
MRAADERLRGLVAVVSSSLEGEVGPVVNYS